MVIGMLLRLLISIAASGMVLSACASGSLRSTDPTPAPATTDSSIMPQTMPTARVLARADKAADATTLVLPPDRDERETSGITPTKDEVIRALPKVGSFAPDFTLRAMNDSTVTLSALRGHPVVINFWASWCPGCRAEAPELQKLYTEYQERGLIILGINVTQQDTVAAAQAYVAEYKLTFHIPMDEQGDVLKAYHVPGLPTSFFVDPRGIIRNVIIGQMDRATMLESLELTKPW